MISNKYNGLDMYRLVCTAVEDSKFKITKVISGGAIGIDQIGERWANDHKIPFQRFLPDWTLFRGNAGHVRNTQMAQNADALIAVWDGFSNGTEDMITIARAADLKVYVFRVDL